MANIFIIRQITRPEAYDYSVPKEDNQNPLNFLSPIIQLKERFLKKR